MAEVGAAGAAAHLRALQTEASIRPLLQQAAADGPGEAGPTTARVEFLRRGKQRLAGGDVHVNATAVLRMVGVAEGRLCRAALGHLEL